VTQPLGVADPDTDRGALPLPAEQLTLCVREPLQVVGMHELRAEGAAAHPGVGLPPEDLQGGRAHRTDGALGVQDGDDVRGGVDHGLESGLPLPDGVVGLLALGDVHGVAEGVGQGAVVVVGQPGDAVQPAVAVLEQEPVLLLKLRSPLEDGPLQHGGEVLAVLGVELVGPEAGRPQHLLLGVAEQPLDIAADVALAAAAQQPPEHHHRAPGDDVLQQGRGLPQRPLALAEQHRGPLKAAPQLAEGVAVVQRREQRQPAGQPVGVLLQQGRPAGHAGGEQQHGRDPAGDPQQHTQPDRAEGQGAGLPRLGLADRQQ
jgi:hypothetical protein